METVRCHSWHLNQIQQAATQAKSKLDEGLEPWLHWKLPEAIATQIQDIECLALSTPKTSEIPENAIRIWSFQNREWNLRIKKPRKTKTYAQMKTQSNGTFRELRKLLNGNAKRRKKWAKNSFPVCIIKKLQVPEGGK